MDGGASTGRGVAVTDLDSVMRKVRALHRLSTDSGATEHEAAAAASAAQRLIEQHHLDVAELEVEGTENQQAVELHPDPLDVMARRCGWRELLAGSIARANNCCAIWRGPRLLLIGTASRVSACRYLYAWLSREVDRLGTRAAVGRGRGYGYGYRVGCAARLGTRLQSAAGEARSGASSHAIVRVDGERAALDALLAGMNTAPPRKIDTSDRQAALDGARAAESIRLDSGPALPGAPAGALR